MMTAHVIQAFLNTGRVRHLSTTLPDNAEVEGERQPPPELSGPPVSEIPIAQRRGELWQHIMLIAVPWLSVMWRRLVVLGSSQVVDP